MKTAVITTVHGRPAHLRNLRIGLGRNTRLCDLHVVVAIDDPDVSNVIGEADVPTVLVDCSAGDPALPVSRARNLGAATALKEGSGLLVFLDVDCIPGRELVSCYYEAAQQPEHAEALLCGPVTYLPPAGPDGYPMDRLHELASPHPARPAPPGHRIVAGADYRLFWSLSFAVTSPTWCRIGGFSEDYRGYGGEDTDFAQRAAAQDVFLKWVGGADAFHQYHPVSDPPVEHLDDILRNAAVFEQKWGWWPMEGWLQAFESLGLIGRDPTGKPVRLSVDRRVDAS
ncbi:galactosyltransferase-related protein [Mycobacterium sp. ITM-2016-00316]|uniref:glycosyltransferase family 2 protein n=1 Tax=Mycobacterium sp. ITM-2016-00316 TaxID=2099695 RepID=UPI000CFA4598|nr:galactosyltransferase-related protein [Mycobacterium sp. ITM-2016-00316]WNG82541.1 galactosyltransferase-related protein [Mycobacterium sp. ITM-2016-00316]